MIELVALVMRLRKLLRDPFLFYHRAGRYYPTFWGEAWTSPRLKHIHGAPLARIINFFDSGTCYALLDKTEFQRCREQVFKKLLAHPRLVERFATLIKRLARAEEARLELVLPKLQTLSAAQLSKVVRIFNGTLLNIQLYGDSTYYFAERIANETLEKKLAAVFKSDYEKVREVISVLTAFERLSFMQQEKCELAAAVSRGRTSTLQGHIKKWRHLKFDYWGPVASDQEFKERFSELKKNKKAAQDLWRLCRNYTPATRQIKKELIKQHQLKPSVVKLADLVSKLGFLNDTKKGAITRLTYFYDEVLCELARRNNIPLQWIHHLIAPEVEQLAAGKITPSPAEMQSRMRRSALVFADGCCKQCVSGEADDLLKELANFVLASRTASSNTGVIKGQGVYNGVYQGPVVKMYSHEDIRKAKQGMVLVAPKTTVDFVAAMHQAGAVVTDYGGLTSHPAIVARELKIPGVVGTNIGTQILHDGDIVLVDGGRGEVKIVKKSF